MPSTPVSDAQRRKILTTLAISLLLDLISFTFILPLFPSVLSYYRAKDTSPDSLLNKIFHYLNAYKNTFSKPIDSRYDIVLLGGAFGSLFSFLQALAAPVIGRLSDKHGRRKALLCSMAGNILSVALWVGATDFRTFLASRVVGGLSEGNVQLAHAIVTDISSEKQRTATMAIVGACFSIAFTCGPALGAALASITTVASNQFATAAGVSLLLIVAETIYIYISLPETHPRLSQFSTGASSSTTAKDEKDSTSKTNGVKLDGKTSKTDLNGPTSPSTTNTPNSNKQLLSNTSALNIIHLLFLLPFSGMEFSLPFLSATLYTNQSTMSPSALNGRLLSLMGLIASLLQGTIVRRLPPLTTVRIGVIACAISFFMLARASSMTDLYLAGALLAVTSATVVTGLNSLGSLEAKEGERGVVLGRLRSWGQFGRACGPVLFCSLFWWVGREVAYTTGGVGMVGVVVAVFTLLKTPSDRAR